MAWGRADSSCSGLWPAQPAPPHTDMPTGQHAVIRVCQQSVSGLWPTIPSPLAPAARSQMHGPKAAPYLNMGPDGVSVKLFMKRTPFSSSH